MIRAPPDFTASRQALLRVRAFGHERPGRGWARQAENHQASNRSPEGDCKTVNHGQDIAMSANGMSRAQTS